MTERGEVYINRKQEQMLEVIGKENNDFIVKDSESGNTLKITDTFAEMFSRVEMSPANSPFFEDKDS